MGCLNADCNFDHRFGNIHLSGPCNRACYFCIGQHMMALDSFNNLDTWPLDSIEAFVEACRAQKVTEINVTGTNTDPLLYCHTPELQRYLKEQLPDVSLGIRSNGVLLPQRRDIWKLYDKYSVTVCSFDPRIYCQMMGKGSPPNLEEIVKISGERELKINVVLGPENTQGDLWKTLDCLAALEIHKVNLREPYGQPHVGNPFRDSPPTGYHFGMPYYSWGKCEVTYWDVHFVQVESINLYANGRVSLTYPISKGHCPQTGSVWPQSHFPHSGRIQEQWLDFKRGA